MYCQTLSQWQVKRCVLFESYRAHRLLADRVLDSDDGNFSGYCFLLPSESYVAGSCVMKKNHVLWDEGQIKIVIAVWGVRFEKLSLWACFQVFSTIQGKIRARHLLGLLLRGSAIAIITHVRQARTCGRVQAPGPTPSAPKQWKLDVHVKS